MPSLVHGNLTLYESLIVNEYIAETWGGQRLRHMDPASRARGRLLVDMLDNGINPAFFTYLMNKDHEKEIELKAELDKCMSCFEEEIVGPFLQGEELGLADAAFFPFVERMVISLMEWRDWSILDDYPRLGGWFKRMGEVEAVRLTRKKKEDIVSAYRKFIDADYKFGGLNKNKS